jgi:DNA-binding beta-propeller fold protein YncE
MLTGCALENTAAPSADLVPSTAIAGTVHGGSQPIFGSKVYLLAVNPTGYAGPGIAPSSANASVSLLTSLAGSATPDSIGNYATTNSTNGGFSLSGAGVYSCTVGYTQGDPATTVTLSGTEQVYLYVLGGTPLNAGGPNTSSGMLVALGPCNAPSTKVTVNEITTAAMAYAFAGFASDATHIGSSGSTLALTGLNNAYANVANLAVVSTGAAADTYGTNIIRPTQVLTTVADMLAACVNGTTNNSNCTILFAWTKTEGASGTAAGDTATAAIHLAHYPYPSSSGMTSLYGLVPSTGAPFVGGYSAQPNDFTLGLYLTSSGCFNNRANGLAIDAYGSAWSLGLHGLCKFASNGTALTPGYNGYTGGGYAGGGQNLAIDTSNNVWVPVTINSVSTLSEFSNNGGAMSPSAGYTGGGLSSPIDIAIDAHGYVWLANTNGTLSKFDSSGNPVSGGSGYSDGGTSVAFYGVAIDASGNVWAANYSGSGLSEFNSVGQPISPTTGWGCCTQTTKGGLSNPYDVAIDPAGNVWASNHYYASISKFSSGGSAVSPLGGYQGNGSISNPQGIAIDSMGKVWVANPTTDTVSVFTNTGTELSGDPAYTAAGDIYSPVSVAIDGSGNVWVANFDGELVELIGAAAPVVTPIVANLVSPYGSSAVYRP